MENLSLIAAMDKKWGIGIENHLPWHIGEDLAFYKEITMNKNIIMGRKTFTSMPKKAFIGRHPIVLSSSVKAFPKDVVIYSNINDLLSNIKDSKEEYIVVGGSLIYKNMLPYVNTMYLTIIDKEYKVDTYFPLFDESEFDIYSLGEYVCDDIEYERKKYVRRKK